MEFKKFYNLEEIKKYYIPEINTYMFVENGDYINVAFMFDLEVDANIFANNIKAKDITCLELSTVNLDVYDIKASRIIANNIEALAVNVQDKLVYSGEINIKYSIKHKIVTFIFKRYRRTRYKLVFIFHRFTI